MNRILGHQIAAVSERPQTTWQQMKGIYSDPEHGQIIFVDTPGIHSAESAMNLAMLSGALEASIDADIVLVILDANVVKRWDLVILEQLGADERVVIVGNKIDLLEAIPASPLFDKIPDLKERPLCWTSAKDGTGVDGLLSEVFARLPEGPPLYDLEDLTDRPTRFIVAEFVRQSIFEYLQQEIPYSTFVEVEEYHEDKRPVYIGANIFVERESQKQILIGRKGQQIRQIGTRARRLIEELIGQRVYLDLWVKVLPKWTRKEAHLRRAGLLAGDKKLERAEGLVQEFRRNAVSDEPGHE